MGYTVTAHIVKTPVDGAALTALPPGFGWRLYHDEAAGAWLIDAYKGAHPKWPFVQDPYSFGRDWKLPALDAFYAPLKKRDEEYRAPIGLPWLNLALSKALGAEVLSITTTDDDLDFVCRSNADAPLELALGNETKVAVWRDGVLTSVKKKDLGVKSSQLHGVALSYARGFLDGRDTFLDLGSFDCLQRVPEPIASSA